VIPSQPSEADEERPVPAGFSLPIDIVLAPGRAFVKIARTGEWIPALVVIALCGAATIALDTPSFTHITSLAKTGDIPTSSDIAYELAFLLLVVPLLVSMLVATIVTALARWKEPAAPYSRFFSLAINCMVPSALGNVIHGAIAIVRHPSYSSFRAFDAALPDSLGVFAAPGNDREFGFLAHFGIFDAWSFILIGYGISLFAGMRFSTALFIAAALYFMYVFAYN
jgi:hypothetical protein